jgi:hypothetical protein
MQAAAAEGKACAILTDNLKRNHWQGAKITAE